MEREGVKLDTARLAAIAELEGEAEQLEGEIYEARRARVHDRLAPAARRGPLQRARADPQAPRQDGLLDRRAGALADQRRARDRPQDRALARGDEADEHVPRRAARADRSRGRSHPHDLQPGAGGDGPALEHRPQPSEHPDPLRPRAADPRLLRRRGGQHARSPATTTRSSCGSSPTSPATRSCGGSSPRARTSTRRPPRGSSAPTRRRSRPGERSKAKMVNYGIAYGLPAYGLADRLSIPQEEAAAYIERYFERFAGVKRFIDETIERAREEGKVTTLMGRRRLIPELRARQWQSRDARRAARRQHGDPGHRRGHHQAGDDPQPPRARPRRGSSRS